MLREITPHLACAVALLGLAPAALAQEKPYKLSYSEGQLLVLVAPDYPETSLKNGETSFVEVNGVVRVDGTLANPVATSTPPNGVFEAAVMRVVPYWRLQPRIEGKACTFAETPTRVTIWFEIAEGKPKISYSRIPPENRSVEEQLTATLPRQPVSTRSLRYPRNLAHNRNTPDAVSQIAYVGVSPDGTVHSVSVAPKRYHADYEEEIKWTLKQWRFEPATEPWCAEFPIDFKLH